MQCPACQHENRDGARYCEACATALVLRCSQCAAELRQGARFCDQCGTPVAGAGTATAPARSVRDYTPRHLAEKILTSRSALEGERKRVTVLFADMKGSQDLAEQLDAEEWHGILDRFFAILTSGIHRFEGTINQYTGDGIMALFGAPIAHEDHAPRACHAALAVMAELRRFADELRLTRGLNLSMRIGLNSGEVVVGRIGDDLRMDYTAQGHTVGLAARMEQIAEPGRIYLTRNTAALVEGYFRLRDLGAMAVKGSRQPVQVYELEGVGEIKTRLDMSRARGLSRFIGREPELRQLGESLERVRHGAGEVAAVAGNAGIGKSRLCHELTERCRNQGMVVHRATCVPYHNALPFFPVLGLLRSYFGLGENEAPAEARRKVAGTLLLADEDFRELLPVVFDFLGIAEPGAPEPAIPPELRQQRLQDMMLRLLPARDRPVLLLVEDLHWADAGSEEFLTRLAAAVKSGPSLLLLNYRPDYPNDWLQPSLDVELALSALGEAELAQLTTDLLGTGEELAAVARLIRTRAGGNPFFVEEAVQALVEAGNLQGRPGAYRLLHAVDQLAVPDTVQAILAARIDRLAERDKHLLQVAAVVGREFSQELLARVAELPETELGEALTVLEEGGFVHRQTLQDLDRYTFCHPLTQEVAYQSQLAERRARIHSQLAEALEAEIDEQQMPSDKAVLLAHHWERAGNLLKAAQWSIPAAIWSAFRDVRGGLQRFRRAIELLDGQPLSPQAQSLGIAARAGLLRISGLVPVPGDEIDRAYAEARALAEQTGDRAGLAELLMSYGSRQLNLGGADQAASLTEEGMRLALELGHAELQSRFRLPILLAHFAAGRLHLGIDLLEASSGGHWTRGEITLENFASRGFRAAMLACMGQLPLAQRELERAIAVGRAHGRPVSWLHANLVEVATFSGHTETAMREARTAVAAAEENGSALFLEVAYRALAQAHVLQGQWREAIELLERSLPLVQPEQPAFQFESAHRQVLADAWLGVGDTAQAARLARAAVSAAERGHMRIWEIRARLALCRVLRADPEQGRPDEPAAHYAAVQALIERTGATTFSPFLAYEQSLDAVQTGDAAACREQWQRAAAGFRDIGAELLVERLGRRLQDVVADLG